MAFTANTAFEARLTNNANDILANVAGLFQSGGSNADCSAGTLCVRGARTSCQGFSGVYNENAYVMTAAANTAGIDDVIYACNTYDNQLVTAANGNSYYVGRETLGLGVPAGRYGNFTRINFDGQSIYRFGAGNVTINTTNDQYFTIASGALSSVTAEPSTAGKIYFKLVGTGNFTTGTSQSFGYYDVVACKVTA